MKKSKNSFADGFYRSTAWKKCRAAFISERRGLCENCLSQGVYTSGEEVHHKIKLTPRNLNEPSISLNHDNLMLLCKRCHEEQHGKHKVMADEQGHVEL